MEKQTCFPSLIPVPALRNSTKRGEIVKRWSLVLGMVAGLAACSPKEVNGAPTEVSAALTQALALGLQISAGGVRLQEARDLGFAMQPVQDLSGQPLHQMVLVGPRVTNFWKTAENPVPGEKYSIYAIGATKERSLFSFILTQDYFAKLVQTRKTAGSFKRFLSAGGGSLYLEDQTGKVWDTDTAKEVPVAELTQTRQAQQLLMQQRRKDGILQQMQAEWDKLEQEALTQSANLPSLRQLTLPSGDLNVTKLIAALEQQKNRKGLSAQYANERGWCMGWFCAGMGYASVVRQNKRDRDIDEGHEYNNDNPQDTSDCAWNGPKCKIAKNLLENDTLGNRQFLYSYEKFLPNNNDQWGAWDFGLGGLQRLDVVGCGPLSITRLFAWYATRRGLHSASNVNLVNSHTFANNAQEVATQMFEPQHIGSQNNINYYQPRIAHYTDTWWLSGSGFTRDTNMMPGANTWIRNHASAEGRQWELRGSSRALIQTANKILIPMPLTANDFARHTWSVRDVVRGKIGRDNEPVIIMYGPSLQEGHYALSQAYIVHEGWFSANVMMWITDQSRRTDLGTVYQDLSPGRFVNITEFTGYYSGAYGLYRK
jgi:hypothetical protein